jgi:glycosyltransferase involved in cell wall biosynthesis
MKFVIQNHNIYPFASGSQIITGGAERQQWLLARALVKHGHDVVVYSLARDVKKMQKIEGVTFKWMSPLSPIFAWPRIACVEKADWWYWRGQDYYLGYLGLITRLSSTRLLFACAFDTDCVPSQALTRRKYLCIFYALGLFLSTRIFVQHMGQFNLLSPWLQKKATLVPSFSGDAAPITNRADYVAWVAALREPKRPHLIAEIARRLPNVRFVVCGSVSTHRTAEGYSKKTMQILLSCPNIEYRGQVSPEEAQSVIRNAGLLLSTSNIEGFPNTFLQAWAEGVPVVSLELDPDGVINKYKLGKVSRTIEECVVSIRQLLNDRVLNNLLGANGIEYVKNFHSEDVMVAHLLTALA